MSAPSEVSFATSDGSKLSFCTTKRIAQDTQFLTTVETPWLRCAAPSSTYMCGPPTTLFAELAANWRGWDGERRWADLEGRVALAATADSLGHVTIKVTLKGPNHQDLAEIRLIFAAGALENMSVAIATMFDTSSNDPS
jgi:hypothetical protein